MKKTFPIIFFSLIILLSGEALSQVRFGLRLGANIANLVFNPKPQLPADYIGTIDTKSIFSYAEGGFLLYEINDKIDIQAELLFLQKGGKVVQSAGFSSEPPRGVVFSSRLDYTEKNNLYYLSIPVFGKYSFGNKETKIKPFALAGPELDILLNAEVVRSDVIVSAYVDSDGILQTVPIPYTDVTVFDVKDQVESINFTFNIGMGIEYKTGQTPLLLEIRYSSGLSNIRVMPPETTIPLIIKTRSVQFIFGILF